MREGIRELRLTVLGCRGSFPVSDSRMIRFGGNTSCYLVEAGGEALLMDAGTGIAWAVPPEGPVHIVFSHSMNDTPAKEERRGYLKTKGDF